MPLVCCIALLWAAACVGASAQAPSAEGQPTWAVEVARDSACAGDADFSARLSAAIPARQRAALPQAELRARVAVGRDRTASLSVFDQETQREAGQRRITVPRGSCAQAAEALAFVIAVMVEAGRSVLPPAEPAAEARRDPPPAPPPAEPEEEAPRVRRAPRYRRPERYAWQGPPAGHDVTIQAGLGVGLLPGVGWGGNLAWGIRGQRLWPVWLSLSGWLERPSEDLRARFAAAYGTLATCPLAGRNHYLRARLCGGLAAGALFAHGQRLPARRQNVSLLTLGSLQGALHLRLFGPLEFVIEARLEVPLSRVKFTYFRADGARPRIHETAVVAGSFFGGLGLCFR